MFNENTNVSKTWKQVHRKSVMGLACPDFIVFNIFMCLVLLYMFYG